MKLKFKLKFKYFAIDFDNTIAYDAHPNIGELISGAKECITKIKELGGEICIWTCRTGEQELMVKEFLDKNNIPYDKINESFDESVEQYGGDSRKVFADIYIDDRTLLFQGQPVDWNIVDNYIFEVELV